MNPWIKRIDRRLGPPQKTILVALLAAVRTGQLRAGDTLPPQRLMADFMGVHVNTVNRAMREAARRGLVTARTRAGTVVTAHPNPCAFSRPSQQEQQQ